MKTSRRIAIAEDEPLMVNYLVETLTLLGHQVLPPRGRAVSWSSAVGLITRTS